MINRKNSSLKLLMIQRKGIVLAQGFSLVEMMVALVIGLIILLAVSQAFVVGKRTFGQVEELSSRQEGLRYMADVFPMHVRTSDFIREVSAASNCIGLSFSSDFYHGDFCPVGDDYTLYYASISSFDGVALVESCESNFADNSAYLANSCSDVVSMLNDNGLDYFLERSVALGVEGAFSPILFDSSAAPSPTNLIGVQTDLTFSGGDGVSDLAVDYIATNRRALIYQAIVKAKEDNL